MLFRSTQAGARLLASHRGERRISNLLHLGELLHQAGQSLQGTSALVRHLGEQAEVEVITRKVDQGLFAPLFALDAYDGRSGLAWTLEDGKLARRALALADRTLDGRALIVSGLPQGARLVVARDRKSTRLNSSHSQQSRMPSSA